MALRKAIRAKRKQLNQEAQKTASEQLCQQLNQHPKIKTAKNIALYLANDGELDPLPFIHYCWQQNKQVFLPVLHPFSHHHLLFLKYQTNTPMLPNQYGIPEPKLDVTKVCPLESIDVLLTPLVAFDQQGERLGMGGGFYDRTLSHWYQSYINGSSTLYPIGIAHNCQQVSKIPTQDWDIPLPEIITPTKRIKGKIQQ